MPQDEQKGLQDLAPINRLKRCTPAVSATWLLLTAGVVWCGVGVGLAAAALLWFSRVQWPINAEAAAGACLAGCLVYRFGFSKIALKNVARISRFAGGKVCLFAFQAWRSYLLILFMVGLGYAIRHLSFLPPALVAGIYLTIGSALFLSSSVYFSRFRLGF